MIFHRNSNSMERTAAVSCAKFHSDHFNITWMWAELNVHPILIMMEISFVDWGSAPNLKFASVNVGLTIVMYISLRTTCLSIYPFEWWCILAHTQGPFLQLEINSSTNIESRAWTSNYIYMKSSAVITYPCPSFSGMCPNISGSLTKLQFNLFHLPSRC